MGDKRAGFVNLKENSVAAMSKRRLEMCMGAGVVVGGQYRFISGDLEKQAGKGGKRKTGGKAGGGGQRKASSVHLRQPVSFDDDRVVEQGQ